MRETLDSYTNVWRSRNGSAAWTGIFVVGAAFALAALPMVLAQRTILYQGAGPHPGWYLIVCFVALLAFVLPASSPRRAYRSVWRFAPLTIVLLPFVPTSLQLAIVMIVISGALASVDRPFARRLSSLLNALLTTWMLCLGCVNVLGYIEARTTHFEMLGVPLAYVLKCLGYDSHFSHGFVFLTAEHSIHRILPSFGKFGGVFVPAVITNLLALGFILRLRYRAVLLACALTIPYAFLRTAALLLHAVEGGESAARWWDEMTIVLSFLPLAAVQVVVLWRLCPMNSESARAKQQSGAWRLAIGTLAGVFLTLGWHWVDPGIAKTGKVLIDERYSRWEWSEERIDEKRFGVKTVYNYYNMVDAISHYYDVERNFTDITDETLADVSVLILKTPTSPYPTEAVNAILRFVERGGGLWLISDHTNVFGNASHLNSVSLHYGIEHLYEAVVDPDANRQLMSPSRFSHPIIRRLPLFLWLTGNPLRAPWGGNDVILSSRLLTDRPDFSVNTGFGNFVPELDERVGSVIQAVAINRGSGRIAVWSDSTVFSNFAVFLPGRMELVLGYVDWLDRRNSTWPIREILLITGLIMLIVLSPKAGNDQTGTLGLTLGVSLSFAILPTLYDRFYPALQEHVPFDYVAFLERDAVSNHLPIVRSFDQPISDNYQTAFVAAQRAGLRPFVTGTFRELGKAATTVVIHGYETSWSDHDISSLISYVDLGGSLILLDAGLANERLLQTITDESGIVIERYRFELPDEVQEVAAVLQERSRQRRTGRPLLPRGPALSDPSGNLKLGRHEVSFTMRGGEPLIILSDEPDKAVAVRADLGHGSVLLCGTENLFSDVTLGQNSAVPDDLQYALLQLLFEWYKGR